MAFGETELEMVRRHVAEGERHVRLQHEIIEHLRVLGAPIEIAEQLMRQFEELLVMHRQHLAKLEGGQTVASPRSEPSPEAR